MAARGAPAIDRFIGSAFHLGPARHALELTGTLSAGLPVQELASPSHKLTTAWMPDGSQVDFYAVANDGSAKTVVFEPRTVAGMRLDVVDGVGHPVHAYAITQPRFRVSAGRVFFATASSKSGERATCGQQSGPFHGFTGESRMGPCRQPVPSRDAEHAAVFTGPCSKT